MTSETKPTEIDVCSGAEPTRAERIAQEAARFAPRPVNPPQPAPRVQAAE